MTLSVMFNGCGTCWFKKISTSARLGIDAWAPRRVTEIAATAFANLALSRGNLPNINATYIL